MGYTTPLYMITFSLYIFSSLLIYVSCVPISHVSTFVISDNDAASYAVTWENKDGGKIACEFTYSSKSGGVCVYSILRELSATSTFVIHSNHHNLHHHSRIRTDKPPDKLEIDPIALISQISKKYDCIQFRSGIFSYDVCLAGEIKQSANSDRHSLGKYVRYTQEDNVPQQLYIDGSRCDAAGGAPRQSSLEFTCSQQARVISVTESVTCKYRVVVGVPEVCDHSAFQATKARFETWMLEVSEMDNGGYLCQVFNNGFDAQSSVSFSDFKLQFKHTELNLDDYVVRQRNRKLVEQEKLKTEETPPTVQTTKEFGYSPIDYAYIKTESNR